MESRITCILRVSQGWNAMMVMMTTTTTIVVVMLDNVDFHEHGKYIQGISKI